MASFAKNQKRNLTKEERGCTLKKFFRFEKLALKEIQRALRKGYMPDHSRAYKCDYCVGWHTTSEAKQ